MVIINLIFIFHFIGLSYAQEVFTPQYMMNIDFPFLLPYSDNENYYLIASQKGLKINKDNGTINIYEHKLQYADQGIFCADKLNNSYLFNANKLYSINHIEFISVNEITNNSCNDNNYIACITLEDNFVIYGKNSNKLIYIQKNINEYTYHCNSIDIEFPQKFSCKFIKDEKFICALIKEEEKIKIHLYYGNNWKDTNNFKPINYDSKKYENLALYDTTIDSTTKILCGHDKTNTNHKTITCCFITIIFGNENSVSDGKIEVLGTQNLTFNSKNHQFSEKDCCFSEFNNEYLFCCGGQIFIICYRLNYSYDIVKQFRIPINGKNKYLSIMTNNLCATFFF